MDADQYRSRIALIKEQIDEIDRRLSDESALEAGELRQQEATVQAVAKALPPGSALIEFVKMRDFDFRTSTWANSWSYLAFVLSPSGGVRLVDLGDGDALEQRARQALNDIRALTVSSTRQKVLQSLRSLGVLYQAAWEPLEEPLKGVGKVLLSTDGMLNLVPFAALEDGQGTGRALSIVSQKGRSRRGKEMTAS